MIVNLVFPHFGFWRGDFFLIGPFPDHCLLFFYRMQSSFYLFMFFFFSFFLTFRTKLQNMEKHKKNNLINTTKQINEHTVNEE